MREHCYFTDEGTLEQCSLPLDHDGEHIFPWQAREELRPKCDECGGRGYVHAGFSGRDDDGNAPLTERCSECGGGQSPYV